MKVSTKTGKRNVVSTQTAERDAVLSLFNNAAFAQHFWPYYVIQDKFPKEFLATLSRD
jgi:hypothetical protein